MKTPDARTRWCLLFLLFTFGFGMRLAASPFYEYKIIAKSGDTLDGFPAQTFKPAVSLNDNGHVAFIGESTDGRKAVFVAEPSGNAFVVRKLAETSSGDYGSVWVNNRNEVAANFTAVSGGVTSASVRRYHSYSSATSGGSPFDEILKGTTARYTATVDPCLPLATCPFTFRFRVRPFDYVMDPVSINDFGMVTCLGTAIFEGGQTFYYLTAQDHLPDGNDPSAVRPQQVFGFLPDFKPVIANSGEIVARVGNRDDAPIMLYAPGLGTPQVIANLTSFTKIGQCPGLSDDGQVVAFYGELKPDKTKPITLQNGEVVSRRGSRVDEPAAYHAEGILYLPAEARFDYLLNRPEAENIGAKVNAAMRDIEKHNPQLAGVLPKTYNLFTSTLLKELLKKVSEIPASLDYDAFGRIFERAEYRIAKCEFRSEASSTVETRQSKFV